MNKHEFELDGKKYRVIKITPEIRLESAKYYNKALNEALDNDYPLSVELERVLESRKLYDPEAEEKKIVEIHKNIKDLEKKLREGIIDNRKMTKEEGKEIAFAIKKERLKLREVGNSINTLLNNTVENYANNERMQYYLFACTVNADNGQRYWKTYEDFKADTENEIYRLAAEELLSVISGIDKDYEAKLYENQWLVKMGYLNKNLQLVNTKGEATDTEGRLINDRGEWVNTEGKRIDRYGNLIDDDGNLLVKDSWDVTEVTK